jgi:hypothetical protein
MTVVSQRASGCAILKRSLPTSDFHLISRIHDWLSLGDCLAEIQDPASSGRSGDRYAVSIGCQPQRAPLRNVGFAGRDGCRDWTPSLMRRPGPSSGTRQWWSWILTRALLNCMQSSTCFCSRANDPADLTVAEVLDIWVKLMLASSITTLLLFPLVKTRIAFFSVDS